MEETPLHVSKDYQEMMMQTYKIWDKSRHKKMPFSLSNKNWTHKWFIDAIRQRQETLL
jgi:DNA-directed RNA polymerase specialized sigma54-like protein